MMIGNSVFAEKHGPESPEPRAQKNEYENAATRSTTTGINQAQGQTLRLEE